MWALAFSALIWQPAFAGKRIALVIGNSAYRNVSRLANPVNDAAVLADTFRKANFDVVDARNDLCIMRFGACSAISAVKRAMPISP